MQDRNLDSGGGGSDGQTPPPSGNPNVFDDEFALDADDDDFMHVSDGFRPAGVSESEVWDNDRQNHDRSPASRPLSPSPEATDGGLRRLASRSSATKAPFTRDSISHDTRSAGTHHNRGPGSQATADLRRHASISSTASFATMAQSESRFAGGPSHPYGMYPQNPMGRTSSVTTSSTERPSHRSSSLRGPSHPYAMYPQNIVEDEPPLPQMQSAIPVGFPGLNTGYHRQIGPDGEEQDIVGPDGHTEQLPPYSRFPEEGPTKAALAAAASATPVAAPLPAPANISDGELLPSPVSPLSPVQPVQPLPTQQQETENRDADPSAALPHQPESSAASPLSASTSEQSFCEKQETERAVKTWRSKKLWGRIPMTFVLAALVLLLVFAVILGAAIGTFVAKNKSKGGSHGSEDGDHHEEPSPQVTPTNTLFDATPIATPTSVGMLPTGSFALPLGIAQESSKNCLTVVDQLSAWSCKMTFAPLVLSINYTQAEPNVPVASIGPLPKPDASILYGIQTPDLGVKSMQLVLDMDFKVYGPAYHFASLYDKVVVLRQDEFLAGAALTPAVRQREEKPPFQHRFQVMPGDFPWYCYWNSTYIEGYIYAKDNSTAATFTDFPTAWPSTPYGTSVPAETAPPAQATEAPPPAPQGSTVPLGRRGDGPYPRHAPYPRIVKIEERRLRDSSKPYCQKMRLLEDYTVVPAMTEDGAPIQVYLEETDPTMEEFMAADDPLSSSNSARADTSKRSPVRLEERDDPPDACHCQWMFQ